jgi:hypothetical protein
VGSRADEPGQTFSFAHRDCITLPRKNRMSLNNEINTRPMKLISMQARKFNYHYGKPALCRVSKTLGNCRVLHSAKDTRKRKCRQRGLCRVYFAGHSAKPLPSAKSRTRQNLSAVTEQAPNGRFAECRVLDTRQRNHLCRAPSTSHSAKKLSLPSAKKLALGKEISLPSVFSRQSAQNYPF